MKLARLFIIRLSTIFQELTLLASNRLIAGQLYNQLDQSLKVIAILDKNWQKTNQKNILSRFDYRKLL